MSITATDYTSEVSALRKLLVNAGSKESTKSMFMAYIHDKYGFEDVHSSGAKSYIENLRMHPAMAALLEYMGV